MPERRAAARSLKPPRRLVACVPKRATASAAPRVDVAALRAVRDEVCACAKCPLHEGRLHAVPGEGTGRSGLLLVGEAPGRKEDESGRPFVGAAGKNLDLALAEAGLARADCFITSVVKCRPPGNRDPTEAEKAMCRPYLDVQVRALRPRVIVALGRHGLSGLIGHVPKDFAALRGTFLPGPGGVPVFVSLHPAAIIYRQKWKAQYLQDWRDFGAWMRGQGPPGFGPASAQGASAGVSPRPPKA